jgi:hypothetical protein
LSRSDECQRRGALVETACRRRPWRSNGPASLESIGGIDRRHYNARSLSASDGYIASDSSPFGEVRSFAHQTGSPVAWLEAGNVSSTAVLETDFEELGSNFAKVLNRAGRPASASTPKSQG